MEPNAKPVASVSSYAPRLRTYNNSLLTPVFPSTQAGPAARTTKRGTTIINYAEDGYDDYDEDDEDPRRRHTGLRSLRRDESGAKGDITERVGKDTFEPVDVQAQWRDWMTRPRPAKNNQCSAVQASLPVTLIPIRIDVDIPSFVPPAALPLPTHIAVDPNLPLFRPQEQTVPYRLRDFFLWNLHEAIITTDAFALCLVQDLDLPNSRSIAAEISKQIRTQLEEYAGVALHPLFHAQQSQSQSQQPQQQQNLTLSSVAPAHQDSPAPVQAQVAVETPQPNGDISTPLLTTTQAPDVTARASPITPGCDDYNPDDTYRCVITLSINLAPKLYTDKFEWSLLHPPGTAEAFAKQTCADLGLHGEWIPALTHAIYEAVLKLKKEACESGGLVGGWGGQQEIANDAAHGGEGGWRYDPESLCDEWRPRVEELTREEIEKREGDREREVRRIRRETARFSSTAGLVGGVPFAGFGNIVEGGVAEEERMGRGERSKKKRRFRSLSPLARAGTPQGGRFTPDVGYGGAGSSLTDQERDHWTCSHCLIKGSCVWAVRDGPPGPKVCFPLGAFGALIMVLTSGPSRSATYAVCSGSATAASPGR
jgi:chromatin structure-remodeling complex subunit SFH1